MFRNIKSKADGFTIIEVLIVLAIAGLIMLIVFLAIPALQRNSRNTQRRTDIGRMLAAVTESTNNANGVQPTDQPTLNTALTNGSYGYYTTVPNAIWKSGAQINPQTDTVWIVFGAKCSSGDAAAGATRQVAVVYGLEAAGGSFSKACQDS